jgi:hypothetical protein
MEQSLFEDFYLTLFPSIINHTLPTLLPGLNAISTKEVFFECVFFAFWKSGNPGHSFSFFVVAGGRTD